MNLNTGLEDKLPCLENGSMRHERGDEMSMLNRLKKNSSCSQLLQIAKVILLIELGFFVGWIGCVYLWNSMDNNVHNGSESEVALSFGSSATKFTPSVLNKLMDVEYSLTINRGRRSSEGNELERDSCLRRVDATKKSYQRLIKQIITGDESNPTIIMLREKCRMNMVGLTMRAMMLELISSPDSPRPTDEEWRSMALRIKVGILHDTAGEHRQLVEASGPPTEQMITDIRTAVREMITNYRNCEKILPVEESPMEPSLADVLNQRDNCSRNFDALKEDLRPFEAQIVPGDASDPMVVLLRKKVATMAATLASTLTVRKTIGLNVTRIAGQIANMTDDQILNRLVAVKDDVKSSADAEHRRQLDESGPPTLAMVNQVRTLISKYLDNIVKCDQIWEVIDQLRESLESEMPRSKRDVTVDSQGFFRFLPQLREPFQ